MSQNLSTLVFLFSLWTSTPHPGSSKFSPAAATGTPQHSDQSSTVFRTSFSTPSPVTTSKTPKTHSKTFFTSTTGSGTPQLQNLSSSTKKKSKMKHSQLQQILNQEKKKKESSASSSLHNFLSSLWYLGLPWLRHVNKFCDITSLCKQIHLCRSSRVFELYTG